MDAAAETPTEATPQESAPAPSSATAPATEAQAPAPVAAPATAPDASLVERLAALEAQTRAQSEALAGFAAQALADVPESVRKAVSELAGDDAAKQLSTLAALRRNGLAASAVPQGTTTAPVAAAPQPASSRDEDTDALDTYRKLQTSAPIVAATFRTANLKRIERALARTKSS